MCRADPHTYSPGKYAGIARSRWRPAMPAFDRRSGAMIQPQLARLRGNGQPLQGPLPGAVVIGHPVGRGGANRASDARALQIALNAVPAGLGGAGESLALDGLVGPLTIGAIAAFQEQWMTVKDARCDPGGPTLALLNAMAGVGD